ncbi:hypothetical protein FNF31_05455 [Cafeteria roenbergensis]|uniref:Serine aminopeptidase S33 domain-containing protein n=1 Tax=Cafeteria roenbergensis TaxID=33653 RepID=A0A5A8CZM0_CAFRO|nr:hypothetical protein FNF31_05455 [Cafeteria roenbergensis]
MGTTSSTPAQPAEADVDSPEPHVTEPHSEFDRYETVFEPQQQIAEAQKRGWIAVAGVMYENAVKAIIRPPRDIYASKELGPTEFRFRGRQFVRKDFILRNPRNMAIQCSHWMPADEDRPSPRIPCVVCLHGNSSSRVSAKFNLDVVLNEGASLLAIDFAGSGRSDGRWVTLGWWEKDDLATVLEYIRSEGRTSSVALWGRSMGAATSLLHCPRDPLIDGMILDSPFADLQQLIEEIVERFRSQAGVTVPSWVTGTVIRMVQNSVFKRTGMDILRLKPAATAYLCHVRALITAGRDDTFVAPHHATAIYEEYRGAKELVLLDGQDHNSQRPRWFQDRAGIFLRQALHIPDELPLYREFGFESLPETLGVAWTRAIRAGASSAAAVTMAAAESERDVRGSERAMQDFGRLRTVDSATPPLPAEEEEEDDELQQAIRRSLEEHQPTLPGRASDPPESPRLEEAHVPHGGEVADEAADAAEAAAEAANAADATTSPGE